MRSFACFALGSSAVSSLLVIPRDSRAWRRAPSAAPRMGASGWLWALVATAIAHYAGCRKVRPKLPVAFVARV